MKGKDVVVNSCSISQDSEAKHISQRLQDLHLEVHKKFSKLEKVLNKMIMQKEYGPTFDQKEVELRKLKQKKKDCRMN